MNRSMTILICVCVFQAAIFASLQSTDARTIEYYIGAVDVMWDYAPSGINLKTGVKLDDDECVFLSILYLFAL